MTDQPIGDRNTGCESEKEGYSFNFTTLDKRDHGGSINHF